MINRPKAAKVVVSSDEYPRLFDMHGDADARAKDGKERHAGEAPEQAGLSRFGFLEEKEFKDAVAAGRIEEEVVEEYQKYLDGQLGKLYSSAKDLDLKEEVSKISKPASPQKVQFLLNCNSNRTLPLSFRLLNIELPPLPEIVKSTVQAHQRTYDRYLGSVIWPTEMAVSWKVTQGSNWQDCLKIESKILKLDKTKRSPQRKPNSSSPQSSRVQSRSSIQVKTPATLPSARIQKSHRPSLRLQPSSALDRLKKANLADFLISISVLGDQNWIDVFRTNFTSKEQLGRFLSWAKDPTFNPENLSAIVQTIGSMLGFDNQVVFFVKDDARCSVVSQAEGGSLLTVLQWEPKVDEKTCSWWIISAILESSFELFVDLYAAAREGLFGQLKKRPPNMMIIPENDDPGSKRNIPKDVKMLSADLLYDEVSLEFIEKLSDGSIVLQATFQWKCPDLHSGLENARTTGKLTLRTSAELESIVLRSEYSLFKLSTQRSHQDLNAVLNDLFGKLWKVEPVYTKSVECSQGGNKVENAYTIDLHLLDLLDGDGKKKKVAFSLLEVKAKNWKQANHCFTKAILKAVSTMYKSAI